MAQLAKLADVEHVLRETRYLVFTLAEQLLLAHVVNPEQFSNSNQHSSLKRSDSQRDVLYGGL